MSVGVRALVAVCALGGGGGVPWLLHKLNSGNSTSPRSLPASAPSSALSSESTTDISASQEPSPKTAEEPSPVPSPALPVVPVSTYEENCTLEEKLKDLEDSLWNDFWITDLDTFIKVTCTNTNKDSVSQMPNEWAGLFPNSLIKERKELTKGKKFEIKTQTESLGEERFKTVFSGSHFYGDVAGEWTKKVLPTGGTKEATEVTIIPPRSSSEKIYLLFK